MTLNEFKAWLEGYLEAGGSDLNAIQGRLAKVHEMPVTIPPIYAPSDPFRPYCTTPIVPPYTTC
ncbi:hypothetical protein [Ruegeria jejuensis]|uniref:hypothetical protein n=1 Tax=Ruegeria jejuensis TaxID=3233338 RepID=UPI00355B4CEE